MSVRLLPILTVDVRQESDLSVARQRAKQVGEALGLSSMTAAAFATAVSELARNALRFGGGGKVEFGVRRDAPAAVTATTSDRGPGIDRLADILAGEFQSARGKGVGIPGARRVSDEFEITSAAGSGTAVMVAKYLPAAVDLSGPKLAAVADLLARNRPSTSDSEDRNRDLLVALDGLRTRQAEVERLNAELAETNRGVMALYTELDERADALKAASESKTRFLSDMTHELRTPLNAMISISELLLNRLDGDLTPEQERQVRFIYDSAVGMGEMVNDLLDIAKIEAGRTDVRADRFGVDGLLAGVRGMFRPLMAGTAVELVVDDLDEPIDMIGDQGKVGQILRNLVSNGVKFTTEGRVRVSAAVDGDDVVLTVADTGIGIAAESLGRIFEEFAQIDGPVQRRSKGTGLGLPLVRKLTELMGGDVSVSSELGRGSVFTVRLPRRIMPALTGDDTPVG